MTVVLIIGALVLIGLWKFGKFDAVSNGIRNLWNRTRSPTPPAPGTPTPPAKAKNRAMWIRLAVVILVILALANANVREMIWSTGKPAVQSWTTGAKTFDVTITSTDEFVIGTVDAGYWKVNVPSAVYWCKYKEDGLFYHGNISGLNNSSDTTGYPAPQRSPSALLVTIGLDRSGWVAPGELLVARQGDTVKGILNNRRNCPLETPITIQLTLSKQK